MHIGSAVNIAWLFPFTAP